MIDIYGADAIRWFMLSDSPPDRDIQWSNEGVSSAHKFIQKIWQINQKILKRKDVEKSLKDENIFSAKVNKYLFKITNLIEKFHLNVAVANFYEIFRLINESIETKISNKCLKDSQINIMKIIMPFIPHMASECLIELEGKDFYLHSKWPNINKSLLEESDVTIIVQINGKKRGLISVNKDTNEKVVIDKAKK